MAKPDWTEEIKELEEYFNSIELPETIQLSEGVTIVNVRGFIDGHLTFVKHNNGNQTFMPYLIRLMNLKDLLNLLQEAA